MIIMAMILIVIGLVIYLLSISMAKPDEKPKKNVQKPIVAGQNINEEAAFRGKVAGDVTGLNSEVEQLKQKLEQMERERSLALAKEKEKTSVSSTPTNQQPASLDSLGPPPNLSYSQGQGERKVLAPPPTFASAPVEVKEPSRFNSLQFDSSSSSIKEKENKRLGKRTALDDKKQAPSETYIPAGTVVRAVMLSGVDAPAGGQAAQNALPVILRLIDNASLPNFFRAQLKNCRMIGKASGELSTERAHISIESLSCVNEDGQAIDVAIKASVFGEDGKPGLRGVIVERNGRALANATLAALGSGIGNVFKAQSTNTTTTLTGQVETIPDAKLFKAGFGEGMAKAFERISQYYLKVADQIFPAIEIDSGRTVDVTFLKGAPLQIKEGK
jgi:conjugal transfer pilus assembly protein TraB